MDYVLNGDQNKITVPVYEIDDKLIQLIVKEIILTDEALQKKETNAAGVAVAMAVYFHSENIEKAMNKQVELYKNYFYSIKSIGEALKFSEEQWGFIRTLITESNISAALFGFSAASVILAEQNEIKDYDFNKKLLNGIIDFSKQTADYNFKESSHNVD